jgi:hypothetical protein
MISSKDLRPALALASGAYYVLLFLTCFTPMFLVLQDINKFLGGKEVRERE